MTAPVRPTSVKTFQAEKWTFVPTIATQTAPTNVEITAVSTLDISCMLFDATGRPTKTTNTVPRERRICDGAVYQQIGMTTYSGGEMIAAFDPQGAAASTGVKAWEKFPDGTVGFLVRRLGVNVQTDFAVGQFVDVFPVSFGPPFPMTQGAAEAAEGAFSSTFAITGPPTFKVALV